MKVQYWLQASEAESRAAEAEAELEELREAAASSGSTIEQWQSAYADLQQQQATAEAELQQLREEAGSSGGSIEEWKSAYADLQQHYSALQVSGAPPLLSACIFVHGVHCTSHACASAGNSQCWASSVS